MVIESQTGDKIIFLESGCVLCIEPTSDDMLKDGEYGFYNGKYGGCSEVFPYAVVFYNPAGKAFRMGVYEDLRYARDELGNILACNGGKAYCL